MSFNLHFFNKYIAIPMLQDAFSLYHLMFKRDHFREIVTKKKQGIKLGTKLIYNIFVYCTYICN